MKIGIQGVRGSACDEAASKLCAPNDELVYLVSAGPVIQALLDGRIDSAVLAMESPLGVSVEETAFALHGRGGFVEVAELRSEVRHCILVRHQGCELIRRVASHAIPLEKHRIFLEQRFPGYTALVQEDTGAAAEALAAGNFGDDTAVIALARAAEIFGLYVLERDLPANDRYLTRFVLLERERYEK